MSKTVIGLGIAAVLGIFGLFFLFSWMGYSNSEVRTRNLITAKQEANKTVLDTTLKTISQTAQVTTAQMDSIKEIIVGYADARKVPDSGKFATLIHESIPNVDTSTFNNLQNIIVSARATFQRNQTELLDLNRVHEDELTTMPSSWFVGWRPHIEVEIVTSSRVESAFSTGTDDNDSVFGKK